MEEGVYLGSWFQRERVQSGWGGVAAGGWSKKPRDYTSRHKHKAERAKMKIGVKPYILKACLQ